MGVFKLIIKHSRFRTYDTTVMTPCLSDSGASLTLDLFCVFILLISDKTLDSRYLKGLVNITGDLKYWFYLEEISNP